jgi:hypothetical protein
MLNNQLQILCSISVVNRQHQEHPLAYSTPPDRKRAIAQTTPCLSGLFSVISLMASSILKQCQFPVARTAWYRKEQATFSDFVAFARLNLWDIRYYVDSVSQPHSTEFISNFMNQMLDNVSETA